MIKTPQKQRGFINAIIGGIGGALGSKATTDAASTAAEAKNLATAETKRQFDITQEQLAPYREAGERGLGAFEAMLNQYGEYEVPSDIPEAYVSPKNLPALQDFESGDYFNRIESNIPDEFSYSNEDFMGSPGRAARLEGGLAALSARGLNPEGMEGVSQNLANREFGAARGRAYDSYLTDVGRESERYGRGVDEYGRLTGREAELYGRDRQSYLDDMNREQESGRRAYRDYTTDVAREEEQYRRGLESYGRDYIDPMNRYAKLAGIGESTTTGLGGLRQGFSGQIARNTVDAGRLLASGELGAAKAMAQGFNQAGRSLADYGRR